MLGRFLDHVEDEQRDRLISSSKLAPFRWDRCLVTVLGDFNLEHWRYYGVEETLGNFRHIWDNLFSPEYSACRLVRRGRPAPRTNFWVEQLVFTTRSNPVTRYDAVNTWAIRRWGKESGPDKITRLLKERAAKRNHIEIPELIEA